MDPLSGTRRGNRFLSRWGSDPHDFGCRAWKYTIPVGRVQSPVSCQRTSEHHTVYRAGESQSWNWNVLAATENKEQGGVAGSFLSETRGITKPQPIKLRGVGVKWANRSMIGNKELRNTSVHTMETRFMIEMALQVSGGKDLLFHK